MSVSSGALYRPWSTVTVWSMAWHPHSCSAVSVSSQAGTWSQKERCRVVTLQSQRQKLKLCQKVKAMASLMVWRRRGCLTVENQCNWGLSWTLPESRQKHLLASGKEILLLSATLPPAPVRLCAGGTVATPLHPVHVPLGDRRSTVRWQRSLTFVSFKAEGASPGTW